MIYTSNIQYLSKTHFCKISEVFFLKKGFSFAAVPTKKKKNFNQNKSNNNTMLK